MDVRIKVKKRHPVNSSEEVDFAIVLDRKIAKGIIYVRSEPFVSLSKKVVWLTEGNGYFDTVEIHSNTDWTIT